LRQATVAQIRALELEKKIQADKKKKLKEEVGTQGRGPKGITMMMMIAGSTGGVLHPALETGVETM
jgi:hypothetical protein